MTGLTDLFLRLRALLHLGRAERELQEELAFHQAKACAAGQPPSGFGSMDRILEECRDARGLRWLEDGRRDLRLALRRLRASPAFTTIAVLTLALGIGGNAALFSLMDTVLLRPLPVPHSQQLVLLGEPDAIGVSSGTQDGAVTAPTYAQFQTLRRQAQSFTGLAAFSTIQPTMRVEWGNSADSAVPISLVSANYFRVLELAPALGRFFGPAEAGPTAAPEAVLSYAYWRQKFGGNASAIGSVLRLHGQPFTVIGVAPRGFTGTTVGQVPSLYVPMALVSRVLPGRDWLHDPPGITRLYWLLVIGRLRPGVTQRQARTEVAVIFGRSVRAQASLAPNGSTRTNLLTQTLLVNPASRGANALQDEFDLPLLVLMALVGIVLLLVVVNLNGMLLAQAAARQREFAMRRALGAGQGRLLRQALTESLLVASLGGIAGWFVAQWGVRLLVAGVGANNPTIALPVSASGGMMAFTAALCLLAGLGFGLAPALHLSRGSLARQTARWRRGRTGAAWIIAQAAFCLTLVTCALLFARSLSRLHSVPLGFPTAGLSTFNLNASMAGASNSRALAIYRRVAEAARRLPGVTAVTYSDDGLFRGTDSGDDLTIPGYTGSASAVFDSVAPGYFAALGIPIREGREFTADDSSRGTLPTVIDEATVRRYFGNRDPIGHVIIAHFTFGDQVFQIIGVSAKALIESAREPPDRPRLYFDIERRGANWPVHDVNFELRLTPGARLTRSEVNRLVAASGMALQVNSFTTVSALLMETEAPDRLLLQLSSVFGLLALAIAAFGLYAMFSHELMRRRAEIGIRLALGARPSSVIAMVLRQALALLAAGIALGALASIALGRSLASLLFNLQSTDPASLAASAALLLAVGLAATLLPALRASRTDPARTLRAE